MKKKSISKMRCLAISQMNMMQVVLQKVAYRSKDIHKQEKLVQEKLKRKQIRLEDPGFNLMGILHRSLQISSIKSQQKLAQKVKLQLGAGSDHLSICPSTTGTRSMVEIRQAQLRREHSELFNAMPIAQKEALCSENGQQSPIRRSDSDVSNSFFLCWLCIP